jgi:RsiW-degrading membrane proteinase PrsW (M82 family)
MAIVIGLLLSIVVAIVPTIIYAFFIWWLDRYEREPGWLLTIAFLWGAIPAIIVSLIAELILDIPLSVLGQGLAYQVAGSGLGAPIIEELAKGLALLGILIIFRGEFDDVLDGIVYGALIGFGFAMTEDIFYFAATLFEKGFAGWGLVVFLRVVLFGLNHALFTAVTGVGLGIARLSKDTAVKVIAPLGGLAVAMTLHSIHNIGASLAEATYCLSFLGAFASDWAGVLILFVIIFMTWRKEKEWIIGELREEVGRTLSPADYAVISSYPRRLAVRWGALLRADFRRWRQAGQFMQTASELAFKKHQLRTYSDEGGARETIEKLRRQLIEAQRIS